MYNVIDELMQGEGSAQNYTASYWSVLFTLMHHMTFHKIGIARGWKTSN